MPFTELNPRPHLPTTASRIDPPSIAVSNLYRDLFDKAPTGYVVLCRDGLILEANRAAIVLLGSLNESLIGRRLASSVMSDAIDQFEQLLLHARTSDEVVEGELLFSRSGGTPFWASGSIQRTDNIETRTSFLVNLKDVSREKAETQQPTRKI